MTDPREIDAFWVQRQLGQYYNDALQSQKLGEEVMQLLGSEDPDGQVENKLVLLLDFDKFPFIKKLIKNRWKSKSCLLGVFGLSASMRLLDRSDVFPSSLRVDKTLDLRG